MAQEKNNTTRKKTRSTTRKNQAKPKTGSREKPTGQKPGNKAAPATEVIEQISKKPDPVLSDFDIYLYKEGKHFSLYEKLGAKILDNGVHFAVWAPNAKQISVIGDFNGWAKGQDTLSPRLDGSGIWEGIVEKARKGSVYKYYIESSARDYTVEKADPFALYSEVPPKTGSIAWELDYEWKDKEWMNKRARHNALDAPFSVYELHPESWMHVPEENRSLTYREMAEKLVPYLKENGFTHVEMLPVMEHPFSGSWGYQVTGFYAPTSRFGTPEDFMYLVDTLHQHDIGIILDWVPSHFPGDLHGLHYFDGTYLYEHEDPKQGFHPDWSSYIFNYGRNEVREFLISSAHLWFDKYHIDGIRVDAVASMLYLDYSRKEGEWIPNEYGGRENLQAIEFLRDLNQSIFEKFPGVQTIAEESTAWPMVTRPVYTGGLGFSMKWNMGWMHDTLSYFSKDPVHRKYHHNQLTFSIWYAFNENFMLSISHDEVVHGKGSLINKMPGDEWQKFANLRLLYGYMYTHPGKKLLFMGNEFAQWKEWNHQQSLDWHLLDHGYHKGLLHMMRDVNRVYKDYPALHEVDFHEDGFQWIDANDSENSIISYVRFNKDKSRMVFVACNMTPLPRQNYRVGVPIDGAWEEILNSDAKHYGGSGQGNFGAVEATPVPYHDEQYSINVVLPPLGMVAFANQV